MGFPQSGQAGAGRGLLAGRAGWGVPGGSDGSDGSGGSGGWGGFGALAEEVLVIQQQLVEAGSGDVDEAQLGLAGRGGGAAAFRDVLPPAAGGLHHLVHGARALVDKALAKGDGGVVDDGGHLKR